LPLKKDTLQKAVDAAMITSKTKIKCEVVDQGSGPDGGRVALSVHFLHWYKTYISDKDHKELQKIAPGGITD
jgi:hypothetical protein